MCCFRDNGEKNKKKEFWIRKEEKKEKERKSSLYVGSLNYSLPIS
jgi:hypothetical protein